MQAAVEQPPRAPRAGCGSRSAARAPGWAQKVAGSKGPHPLLPFETIISINLIGTFNLLRLAASAMIANEPLRTANAACACTPPRSPRSTARSARSPTRRPRAASSAMTLPAARDLAQYGIRVNTIAPGLFDTPLLAALPEEAAPEARRGRALPAAPRPAGRVRAARLPDRREPHAQRRDDPSRRRAADAAALERRLADGRRLRAPQRKTPARRAPPRC